MVTATYGNHNLPQGVPTPPYSLHPSIEDRLDQEYKQIFAKEICQKALLLYTHLFDVKTLREGGNKMVGQDDPVEVQSITDVVIPRRYTKADVGVPARVYVPRGERPPRGWPVMIYYHGGGWVVN